MPRKINILDCTLRDGGYYNNWDFSREVVEDYLMAMQAVSVDYVELGFRSLKNDGYKGGCGYTKDNYINSLCIPSDLKIGVMVNAGELVNHNDGVIPALEKLFKPAAESPVSLVRIACHFPEVEKVLTGITWLKENGYLVTINLMQIADRTEDEIISIAKLINDYPLDVFYFADSMGGLNPDDTAAIIKLLQDHWKGDIGFHAHDNLSQAMLNTERAVREGVKWVDGTVTGMGRGPGNAKTEYLVVELDTFRRKKINLARLQKTIKRHFEPMQSKYGWGTNTYYYLAGKKGIHPTYIQEMLNDTRYDADEILTVIEQLGDIEGKKFNATSLENKRHMFFEKPGGSWAPESYFNGNDVLLIGTGPGVETHKHAIEEYIRDCKPKVIALNTQTSIDPDLISIRVACHPMRLLADVEEHAYLPQPLVLPLSQLPELVKEILGKKELYDFGIQVNNNTFAFYDTYCTLPNSMVIAYALAIASSGKASSIYLAGFDGYSSDDPRNVEMDWLLDLYGSTTGSKPLAAITPTRYRIPKKSVYGMI